jgi:hypothetical protein
MIREFDAESGSHQTASSAKQSAISAFSAENSKILRMFADFLLPKGTGEGRTWLAQAHSRWILSVENRAGALRGIVFSWVKHPRGLEPPDSLTGIEPVPC